MLQTMFPYLDYLLKRTLCGPDIGSFLRRQIFVFRLVCHSPMKATTIRNCCFGAYRSIKGCHGEALFPLWQRQSKPTDQDGWKTSVRIMLYVRSRPLSLKQHQPRLRRSVKPDRFFSRYWASYNVRTVGIYSLHYSASEE